jgi:hypothetical protein
MLVFLDLYGRKLHRCSSTNEPVRKRMRRAGTVASKGDPSLTDRSKVAPLILSKRETEEKQYKKDQQRLEESTKRRLNDWKIVIGVATVPAATPSSGGLFGATSGSQQQPSAGGKYIWIISIPDSSHLWGALRSIWCDHIGLFR